MNSKKKTLSGKGIHSLYQADPIEADKIVFGRETDRRSRRGFLKGLSSMTALIGAEIVYSQFFPAGMIPAAFANSDTPFQIPGKSPDLVVLNDRPINAETPAQFPSLSPLPQMHRSRWWDPN